jgi:hypothetical protein
MMRPRRCSDNGPIRAKMQMQIRGDYWQIGWPSGQSGRHHLWKTRPLNRQALRNCEAERLMAAQPGVTSGSSGLSPPWRRQQLDLSGDFALAIRRP